MISKITKLSGVGTLHAPLKNGALVLRAKTIIYGENGRGKSTLVAVLRSLASGETLGLLKRKTIKGTLPQVAEFLIGTQPYDLSGNHWTKTYPEICVFDATFISENVYSGAAVDPDHRKNLLSFAIGSQGVSFARKVDELAAEISKKRTEETAAREGLKKFVKGTLTPDQFANLSPAAEGAAAELEEARKKRDAIARASTILNLETPSAISLEVIDRARVLRVLAKSMETVSADAAERVREHIDSAHVSEGWLEEGSRFDTGDACPYCAQSTEGVALVRALKLTFSEAYGDFKAGLKEELETLAGMISGERWSSVKATANGNRSKLIPWREFLGGVGLPFELDLHAANVQAARTAMHAVMGRKLANPLEVVALTAADIAALECLETTITAVDDYNASQVVINQKIAELRNSVSGGNLQAADAEVCEIENRIARKAADADTASKALLETVSARQKLEREKESARSTLDTHMQKVVGKYKDSINKHLKGCGTTFQIGELKTVYTGAKPRFDYVIELFGVPVDLANKPGSPVDFDSALSFGDKGALAFAFFLAKLENDPNRSQQTIVFDDPLSSLDSCRRRYTRQQIARLAIEVAQIIVLTHEEATVADIASRLKESECAIFALRPHGDFSVFAATSVKEITASDYARCFDTMAQYLLGSGKPEEVVNKVRPFLEMNLRYRFPDEFAADDSLGGMIGHIRSCDSSKPLAKMKTLLAELEEVNEYATAHAHGDTALVNSEKMLESDLIAIVTKTIDFGRGLPS